MGAPLIPSVEYAKSGAFNLAYQALGGGLKNLVYLPFEIPNLVGNWFIPEHATFMERLASFSRLVISERRGLGCSDRIPPGQSPTLEDHVDDVLEVMNASYANPATLLAGHETAFIAMLAAAAHPDRFAALILWSPSPSWRRSDDLPWEASDDEIEASLGAVQKVAGRTWAERYIRTSLPSWAGSPEKVALLDGLNALGGTSDVWYQDQRTFFGVDLRDLVSTIRAPTLLLARPESTRYPIESVRYLADHLPNARLVEFQGADALPWVGGADAVLEEVEAFVLGSDRSAPDSKRSLATVLFTDIVDSTVHAARLGDSAWGDLLHRHNAIVREELARFGGVEIATTGDGFFATFDGPARAVFSARAIAARMTELGIAIRAGAHTGEIERVGAERHGMAVHIGARVAALAGASEVLVTSTVKDLTAGSGLAFVDAGEHTLKGVPDAWHLYRLLEADAA